MNTLLIDEKCLLEKFEIKGGWTFTRLPNFFKNKPFNERKVKGTIDGFEISKYHLMPMASGYLFLPIRAEIRKAIQKQAGNYVQVTLYSDNDPLIIPDEFALCLTDVPEALQFFNSISKSEQNLYIKWIFSAKREVTKVNRLTKSIDKLSRKLKLYQPE